MLFYKAIGTNTNGAKPKIELFDNLREIDVAENNVYLEIAHLAFEKSKIVAFLSNVNENNIRVPDNINKREKYIKTYLSTATAILNNIQKEFYDFQKPKE